MGHAMRHLNVEVMVDFLHEGMCLCGARCAGWLADYENVVAFFEAEFGTARLLDYALDRMKEEA